MEIKKFVFKKKKKKKKKNTKVAPTKNDLSALLE